MIDVLTYDRDEAELVYPQILDVWSDKPDEVERFKSLIVGVPRRECYFFVKGESEPYAGVMMVAQETLHHGVVAMALANFCKEGMRTRETIKAMSVEMLGYCKDYSIRYLQRSRHIDECRQILITKEV